MKKGLLIIGILSLFMTVSCKKDHVCSCKTIIISNGQETEAPRQDSVLVKISKIDAINSCNEKDTYTDDGNTKTTKNCEIN
tara:strand:- start:216 stop:458 length:243 start_codon:yes stop_codon:yes gene_type:complete